MVCKFFRMVFCSFANAGKSRYLFTTKSAVILNETHALYCLVFHSFNSLIFPECKWRKRNSIYWNRKIIWPSELTEKDYIYLFWQTQKLFWSFSCTKKVNFYWCLLLFLNILCSIHLMFLYLFSLWWHLFSCFNLFWQKMMAAYFFIPLATWPC